ncbi:DUF732 domain-containing protein [Mycobacterium sp. M1]|uniref:DUF732 domain-containing protein n=1 Tax=Mycolicibacter acidiphilus TaxID=2835306 RepID=A0ABS5RGS6_9MYCO|nr:DUF732 domain-containing protein [Mycolicibacter acidiphilus]MBS9533480.1 DUF732 domain-containing protein [Mycolicibacter acidiphilus]
MNNSLRAIAAAVVVGFAAVATPIAAAEPPTEDQSFFDELAKEGFQPDYDKQICGSIKCEPLRDLVVAEGHAICTGLDSGAAPLVPISVIEYLDVSPDRAAKFIAASRHAYCPQAPDPYSPAH